MERLTTSSTLIVFVILILGSCLPFNENLPAITSISTPNNQSTSAPSQTSVHNDAAVSILPTSTALPSVSAENGKQIVSLFLLNNGNCRLPCILGLTPGKSLKEDAQNLIAFFSKSGSNALNENDSLEVHSYEDSIIRKGSSSSSGVIFWNNRLMVKLNIDYFYNDNNIIEQVNLSSGSWQISGQNETRGSAIVHGNEFYTELLKYYSLDNILTLFGIPRQIVILPFPDDPGHPSPPAHYPFSFVLFYPDSGFLVEYTSPREEQNGYYIGCPTKSHVTLSTWEPDASITLGNAVQYFSNIYGVNSFRLSSFKQIQEVTSLSVEDFYELYKDPNYSECVKTPRNLWP